MPKTKKSWYTSKTLITALVAFIIAASSEIFADPEVATMLEGWIALCLPVVMAILRTVTKTKIGT
jgi:hypothetical protein